LKTIGDLIRAAAKAQSGGWGGGQVGRYLGRPRAEKRTAARHPVAIIDRLYTKMLSHYGRAIGRRPCTQGTSGLGDQ